MTDGAEGITAAEPPGTSPPEAHSGPLGDGVVLAALVAMIATGTGLFFRSPVTLLLGPLAGLVAGLGCRRPWRAAAVGAAGVVLGTAGASLTSNPPWRAGYVWLPDALANAVIAAIVAAVIVVALARGERLRPLLATAAPLLVIAAMWLSAITLANLPLAPDGSTSLQRLVRVPTYSTQMSDRDLAWR